MISDKVINKCTCIIKNSIGHVSTSNMKFRTSVESEILYKYFPELRVLKPCWETENINQSRKLK